MSDKIPENPDGKPKQPGPKSGEMPKLPKIEQKDAVNMAAASQFAYTLVGATLILGWFGHWIGAHLGGRPWDAILMLLFGALGFGAEMYRMLVMFAFKDKPKKDDSKKDDSTKDS